MQLFQRGRFITSLEKQLLAKIMTQLYFEASLSIHGIQLCDFSVSAKTQIKWSD